MERKNYFSSYFSRRFGDVSNSDTEGDTFEGDSISNFLDKIPDQPQETGEDNNQTSDKNDQNTDQNNQIENQNNQPDDQSNQTNDQSNKTNSQGNQRKLNSTNNNPKEKKSKVIEKIDSTVLVFGQFFNPFQISETFIKKPVPPLNSIAERIKVLLYNESEISNAMKNFLKLRYRRKENSLNSFEFYILLFLNQHYPNANEDTLLHFHSLFWGGHAMGLLLRNLSEIQKQDPYVFIHAFAASMAELERDCIDIEFSSEDLKLAGLQQKTFDLWQKSINDDKNKNEVVELLEPPNKIDFNPINIEKLEQVESYLNQASFSIRSLAKLTSPEFEIDIILKSTVIGDRDPDVDINLSKIPNFEIDEKHELLCLLMLKNDLCFYIENLQTRPISVNGYQIFQNQITYILDQSLIEFGNILFIFSINNSIFFKLSKEIDTM